MRGLGVGAGGLAGHEKGKGGGTVVTVRGVILFEIAMNNYGCGPRIICGLILREHLRLYYYCPEHLGDSCLGIGCGAMGHAWWEGGGQLLLLFTYVFSQLLVSMTPWLPHGTTNM